MLAFQRPVAAVSALANNVLRRFRARHRQVALGIIVLIPIIVYYTLRHYFYDGMGRWYWNYLATFHPAVPHFIPVGDWGPVENQPRHVEEIIAAPWMGNFPLPVLTPPVYRAGSSAITANLISPAIVKIHIFSVPSEKAASKRRFIRSVSPHLNMPAEYRHLVEIKFVMGYFLKEGKPDLEAEKVLEAEQKEHGDLIRLPGMYNGENLREGKILTWMRAIGLHEDGGRDAWWLFKCDDDTVMNLPNFLDDLLSMDAQKPTYVGTSLNRWPPYHWHFTGMLTGYSHGVLKSLAHGIKHMKKQDIEAAWDDDVLMGELMYTLPSKPQCQPSGDSTLDDLPAYCDPHRPPPWGYEGTPPNPSPRTGLVLHDYVRRAGDKWLWWIKGDIARHSFKEEMYYQWEWDERIKGIMWTPPSWMAGLRDPAVKVKTA